jgi:hypothetical protein
MKPEVASILAVWPGSDKHIFAECCSKAIISGLMAFGLAWIPDRSIRE